MSRTGQDDSCFSIFMLLCIYFYDLFKKRKKNSDIQSEFNGVRNQVSGENG